MNTPNTVNELMTQAAQAATRYDFEALFRLRDVVDGWMQTDEEREAQHAMLNAYMKLIK